MTRYYHSPNIPCRFVSGTHHLFITFRLTLLVLAAVFISSCEEGTTQIGSELLPGSDFVNIKAIDTLSVKSYTMYDDSVRTDNPSVSYLGQIYDPYFGTTHAEFVTQIRMAAPWDDLPFTVDSVKLFLRLLDVKGGGSDVVHYLKISEIAEQIYTDKEYYSNKTVDTTDFGITLELPKLKSDTVNNIVIKFPDNALGNHLTRDTAKLFHSNSKPDFRSFFKGIYFRMASNSEPLLITLSLAQPTTMGDYNNFFVIFMHDEAGTKKEFYFVLDAMNRNASYNRFFHDFNTASPGKKINHINDGYLDTLSYLQYLNGVYTRITLPGLAVLKNDPSFKGFAVNKARLIVPVYFDGNLYRPSTAPPQLYLRYKTKNGAKYVVPDYNIDSYHSFFDGKIDTTANRYNFNLASFIQGYFEDATGSIEPELEMFQGTGTENVILKANKNKTPVRFEFTYTKF
jgi:hypothetical protein